MLLLQTPFLALLLAAPAPAQAQDPYATAAELGLMQGFPPPPEKRVNLSNALLTPLFNRWSYLHMREIYPSAPIFPADTPIDLPRRMDGALDALTYERPSRGDRVDLPTYLRESYTDALVVVHDGILVYERYLNGMFADQPHQMMSCTKSFAGLMGLIAAENEDLKESDPVTKYVPELAGSAFDATVGQVLDMTNSMDFSEDYADPRSGICNYGVVLGFMNPVEGETYAPGLYEFLPAQKLDPAHAHGEVFHYQTPKTDVVNWVTNRATGQSFQDDMYLRLWSKLGTDGETYVLLDSTGTLFAGGGLNATPMDLARFGAMMTNEGMYAGRRVISKSTIDKLAAGGSREAFSRGPEAKGPMAGGDWSYRAQWWIRHTPGKEAITAIGIHGQWIYCDVERRVAIVKQSSQPVSASDEFDSDTFATFDAIIEHLTR
ncbi:MAG: serine hydrolase [Planctomycetota bacterium]